MCFTNGCRAGRWKFNDDVVSRRLDVECGWRIQIDDDSCRWRILLEHCRPESSNLPAVHGNALILCAELESREIEHESIGICQALPFRDKRRAECHFDCEAIGSWSDGESFNYRNVLCRGSEGW